MYLPGMKADCVGRMTLCHFRQSVNCHFCENFETHIKETDRSVLLNLYHIILLWKEGYNVKIKTIERKGPIVEFYKHSH